MLNPEIKKEWLKRLRDGAITQLVGHLGSSSGERCCLGVLCDIAVDNKVIPEPTIISSSLEYDSGYLIYGDSPSDSDMNVLPAKVQKWAGLNNSRGKFFNSNGVEKWLSGMNDSGVSFTDIADIIQEYF